MASPVRESVEWLRPLSCIVAVLAGVASITSPQPVPRVLLGVLALLALVVYMWRVACTENDNLRSAA